jgi:tRNA pseudouridine55 synthase
MQVPPMFSAKKLQGKKLCDLARKGVSVERQPVKVTMTVTLLSYNYPNIELNVACSKGTYIRSIAHDLGHLLATGAHLIQLRRTRSGSFHIDQCLNGAVLFDTACNPDNLIKAMRDSAP